MFGPGRAGPPPQGRHVTDAPRTTAAAPASTPRQRREARRQAGAALAPMACRRPQRAVAPTVDPRHPPLTADAAASASASCQRREARLPPRCASVGRRAGHREAPAGPGEGRRGSGREAPRPPASRRRETSSTGQETKRRVGWRPARMRRERGNA